METNLLENMLKDSGQDKENTSGKMDAILWEIIKITKSQVCLNISSFIFLHFYAFSGFEVLSYSGQLK